MCRWVSTGFNSGPFKLLKKGKTCSSSPPAQRGLRGHPYKVLHGESHRRRRRSAFSVRVVKYWNKLPASAITASSVNVFKEWLEQVWTEVFLHLLHRLDTHPLTVFISICYPTPCYIYVVYSGPLWHTFYHYKS